MFKLKHLILRARPESVIALYTVPFLLYCIGAVLEYEPLAMTGILIFSGPYLIAVSLAKTSGMGKIFRLLLYVTYPVFCYMLLVAFVIRDKQIQHPLIAILSFAMLLSIILAATRAFCQTLGLLKANLWERIGWFLAFTYYYPIGAIFIHKKLSERFRND